MRNCGRRWNPGNGLLRINNELELEINNPHCSHNKVPVFALPHGSILYFLFQTLLHFISSWSYLSIMCSPLCFLSCEITGYVFVGEAEIWQNIGEVEIKRVRLYLNSGSDSLIMQGGKKRKEITVYSFPLVRFQRHVDLRIKKSFFSAPVVEDYTGETPNSTTELQTLWFPWTSPLMIHRMWTVKNHSGGSCQKNVNTLPKNQWHNCVSVPVRTDKRAEEDGDEATFDSECVVLEGYCCSRAT